MCGRYTLATDLRVLAERFAFEAITIPPSARYNIAPSQQVLALVNDGARKPTFLRWGLMPPWVKEKGVGNRLINARAETVAEKPSFRRSLTARRCLILADGFYEWKNERGRKIPMRLALKSGEPFAFAGLWETWRPGTNQEISSCVIITTVPNDLMKRIHNRMPVILRREVEGIWLDQQVRETKTLTDLLAPYQSSEMIAFPVSTIVNSPGNDSADCIKPAGAREIT